jgi:hypothetical protein
MLCTCSAPPLRHSCTTLCTTLCATSAPLPTAHTPQAAPPPLHRPRGRCRRRAGLVSRDVRALGCVGLNLWRWRARRAPEVPMSPAWCFFLHMSLSFSLTLCLSRAHTRAARGAAARDPAGQRPRQNDGRFLLSTCVCAACRDSSVARDQGLCTGACGQWGRGVWQIPAFLVHGGGGHSLELVGCCSELKHAHTPTHPHQALCQCS